MPWRVIVLIIVLVVFAVFAAFNLAPISISVGFYDFENVPTFLALLIAFVLGALVVLPYSVKGMRRKSKEIAPEAAVDPVLEEAVPAEIVEEYTEGKKPRRKKNRKT